MYFSSRLTVDPSQLTRIEKVEPTKAFKRLLHFMTGGAVSDKVEHETFAAVSVLQLSRQLQVPMPICEVVYHVLYDGMAPAEALQLLLKHVYYPSKLSKLLYKLGVNTEDWFRRRSKL